MAEPLDEAALRALVRRSEAAELRTVESLLGPSPQPLSPEARLSLTERATALAARLRPAQDA